MKKKKRGNGTKLGYNLQSRLPFNNEMYSGCLLLFFMLVSVRGSARHCAKYLIFSKFTQC